MSTKRKALQNINGGLTSLKSGRPVKAYSTADAVRVVSSIKMQGVKVDMVEGVLLLICFKFSLIFSFCTNTVLQIFVQVTHNKLQLNQTLRACCLQDIVSLQTLHYHVQTAKKKLAEEGGCVSQLHEGLLVDVMHGESSTTMSPLTDSSLATTSSAIYPLLVHSKRSQSCKHTW